MDAIKVMVVDDEAPFVEAVSRWLIRRGMSVVTAGSGVEAIQKLAGGVQADVVVLDVKMPGMDGHTCLQLIKLRFPSTEVIMLSGVSSVESAIAGMRSGAYDYLMKPADLNDLSGRILHATRRSC